MTAQVPAYLVFFAGAFAILRWWRQADPLRPSRLGIWRTAVCLLGALIVQVFVPFPSGFFILVCTAIAVQIAAPHWGQKDRTAYAEAKTVEGVQV